MPTEERNDLRAIWYACKNDEQSLSFELGRPSCLNLGAEATTQLPTAEDVRFA